MMPVYEFRPLPQENYGGDGRSGYNREQWMRMIEPEEAVARRLVGHPVHYSKNKYDSGESYWIPDDGAYGLAFMTTPRLGGPPFALFISLPSRENILWTLRRRAQSQETCRKCRTDRWHWHQMTVGNKPLGAHRRAFSSDHPNDIAKELAMSACSDANGCANGRGPSFEVHDPHFSKQLVRDQATKAIILPPAKFTCHCCGVVDIA